MLKVVASIITVSVLIGVGFAHADDESTEKKRLQDVLRSWLPSSPESETLEAETEDDIVVGTLTDSLGSLRTSDLLTDIEMKTSLPWRAPNYSGQITALGWNEKAFLSPAGLAPRVAFWKSIYSKYTSQQGVLHDSAHPQITYGSVDFQKIPGYETMSPRQKYRAREALIDGVRSSAAERLLRLHAIQSPIGLTGEDLRIWNAFSSVNEPEKFKKAAAKGRVRFQLGQKDKFLLGIYFSGRYLRKMEKIFREEGLPIELTRLPFVESSFNVNARSKVGASGIWQFMPRTGKAYMRVAKDVDERNDPLIATRASARVFKQNYMMLESWPLAVTGYNHGAFGVKNIVRKLGTSDLTEIVEKYSSSSFGFASENFYACFLAALEVEASAKLHFEEPRWSGEIEHGELKLTRSMTWKTLLDFYDGDSALAMLMNPHFSQAVRKARMQIPRGALVRVPQGRETVAKEFDSGRLPASKLGAKLKENPVSTDIYSDAAVLDASQAGVRAGIDEPSEAATQIIPALLPIAPSGAAPGNQSTSGADKP